MPKIHEIGTRDFRMDPALYGTKGDTTLGGLMLHETVVDMSGMAIQAVNTVDIFAPKLPTAGPEAAFRSVLPIFVWFAAYRWVFNDTNSDFTEVSMGGNASFYNDLVPVNQLTQANQETKGFRVFDQGAKLSFTGGATPHQHWKGAVSVGPGSVLATPVRANIDTILATTGPYDGHIYFYLLYSSLTETVVG